MPPSTTAFDGRCISSPPKKTLIPNADCSPFRMLRPRRHLSQICVSLIEIRETYPDRHQGEGVHGVISACLLPRHSWHKIICSFKVVPTISQDACSMYDTDDACKKTSISKVRYRLECTCPNFVFQALVHVMQNCTCLEARSSFWYF